MCSSNPILRSRMLKDCADQAGESSEVFGLFSGGEDFVDWDVEVPVVDKYASDLPGDLWKWYECKADWVDMEERSAGALSDNAARLILECFAVAGTAEALSKPDKKMASLLAEFERIPVFIGCNEGQQYYGDLTPKGWRAYSN